MKKYPVVKTGAGPTPAVLTDPDSAADKAKVTQGEIDMRNAMAYAFVVIAVAPLIGIWRGHMWAKANGLVLRKTGTAVEQTSQTA